MTVKADKIAADEATLAADTSAADTASLTTSEDDIAAMQAKLDKAKADRAAAVAKTAADAKARGEAAPQPTRDGRFDDEVLDGFRWSNVTRKWTPFAGVDRTENVPEGFEHVGDGSEENPHQLVASARW